MLKLLLISILNLSVFISCNDGDESDKLPNGSHRAYVECHNTKTEKLTAFAGHIEVKGGVVKKILFPNDSNIVNFDFWITKGSKSQEVYSTSDEVYTVYIIPDN